MDILTQTLAICTSLYIYNVKIFDPEKQKIVFSPNEMSLTQFIIDTLFYDFIAGDTVINTVASQQEG